MHGQPVAHCPAFGGRRYLDVRELVGAAVHVVELVVAEGDGAVDHRFFKAFHVEVVPADHDVGVASFQDARGVLEGSVT